VPIWVPHLTRRECGYCGIALAGTQTGESGNCALILGWHIACTGTNVHKQSARELLLQFLTVRRQMQICNVYVIIDRYFPVLVASRD